MAINKINEVVLSESVKKNIDSRATKVELQEVKTELQNELNEVYQGIVWKPTVPTFDDLRIVYPDAKDGWKSTTEDTNITYQYDLETDVWFPTLLNILLLATSEVDGLMSKGDKAKLDTVEFNAQKNLTAEQLLEQIKTVGGEGSGLDADLFQGKSPDDFAKEDHDHKGLYYSKTESNTLLGGKANKSHKHNADDIIQDENNRFVTEDQISDWDSKANVGDIPTQNSQLENDSGYVTQEDLGSAGLGDMSKGVYDKDNSGVVDSSEQVVVRDTRWDNPKPNELPDNIIRYEFKAQGAIGLPFETYPFTTMFSIKQWGDNTGGVPLRVAFTQDGAIYMQKSNADMSDWLEWKRITLNDREINILNSLPDDGKLYHKGGTPPSDTNKLWIKTITK